MYVEAIAPHRAGGQGRPVGHRYLIDERTGQHLIRCGYVRRLTTGPDWHALDGRELRVEPLDDAPWPTIVACLNIWNDTPALRETLPTWIEHVDAVVIADGPYESTGCRGPSTDGLAAFVGGLTVQCHMLDMADGDAWRDQNAKRTRLLRHAAMRYPDALLFVVDADEFITGAERLRTTPECDVGWVTIESPLYERPYGQPRLIRARPDLEYRGRHHWLYAGDRLLTTHQYGGTGFEHRLASDIRIRNQRGLGHTPARHQAKARHQAAQLAAEREVA